ncbi:serine hydrolase [Streptomyces sp. NPDC058572]|uniref:serine hydrolase n=1 Tax=Streptomyces sp. NPDC058572 TaxID=3346546 RepID=UPI003668AC3D
MSASVSVAVLRAGSDEPLVYGDERTYPCASIVKIAILAALEEPLSEPERERARAMIVSSDNDAATALWERIGGAAGLDTALARLGLGETVADRAWGLTRTTARDQLTLLRAVFEGHHAYLRSLMRQVVPGQDWGVSAAGAPWALKNGWMPMRATGLWVVHSVGQAGGSLIAVLSDGHPTKESGVACVEAAARKAVGAR